MKRLCVFAHYDKNNLIDDYVVYYLRALKKLCKYLIFVSDCDLPEDETRKLAGLADYILAQKHGEYDFGSYKRGFIFSLSENLNYDQLLFVNDSCYGPFYPLDSIFSKMEKKSFDYWGMTQNLYGLQKVALESERKYENPPKIPHIQSYFMVFGPKVFKSEVFTGFIRNISKQDSKNKIITEYELGLSVALEKAGFKRGVYVDKFKYEYDCVAGRKWKVLISKCKFPFLKTSIAKKGLYYTGEVKGYKELIKQCSDYPVEFIVSHSERLKEPYENLYKNANLYRKIRFHLLNYFPCEFRIVIINIEKFAYKILNRICFNRLKKF